MQSPALCTRTTRCQRCGSRRIPLAAPVVLIVRMERSTACRISATVLKRMPRSGSFILGIKWKSQGLSEVLQAVDRSIRTINTTGAAKGILRLPHRWQRVVHNAGDYIEGQ